MSVAEGIAKFNRFPMYRLQSMKRRVPSILFGEHTKYELDLGNLEYHWHPSLSVTTAICIIIMIYAEGQAELFGAL